MIVEYVRYRVVNKPPEDLIDAFRAAAHSLISAPECLSYELTQCVNDPKAVVVRITWESMDARRVGFRQSPGFKSYFRYVRPFLTDIVEMRRYEVSDVAWSRPTKRLRAAVDPSA